jgi:hypothetical protein
MKRLAWIFPWLFTLVRPKYTVKTQGRRQLKAQATDCRHNRHTTAGLVRETGLDLVALGLPDRGRLSDEEGPRAGPSSPVVV